jgi:hypothetical protein
LLPLQQNVAAHPAQDKRATMEQQHSHCLAFDLIELKKNGSESENRVRKRKQLNAMATQLSRQSTNCPRQLLTIECSHS